MNLDDKIFVAGGTGLAGSAIVRALLKKGFTNVIATYNKTNPGNLFSPQQLNGRCRFVKINLLNQRTVNSFFKNEQPKYIFLAAAKVGGIMANHNFRAQFIYENLQIQNNIIHSSYLNKVTKLVFLGSTCIYPTDAPQPMKETYLLTDKLEYLSEPYGVAKIAGIKMCESYNAQYSTNYIAVMPTNLYGPNDNYDLENSHFLPAFIRKMHLGKSLMEDDWTAIRKDLNKNPVEGVNGRAQKKDITGLLNKYGITTTGNNNSVSILLWGSGKPRREILHADELADACLYIIENVNFADLSERASTAYSDGIVKYEVRNTQINIGLGVDYSIYEIALKVKDVVGFEGTIIWDSNMPDGTMQKLTDVNRLNALGWQSKLSLEEGVHSTYMSYKGHKD